MRAALALAAAEGELTAAVDPQNALALLGRTASYTAPACKAAPSPMS